MKKIISIVLFISSLVIVLPNMALAHVTVKPSDVGVGQRLNFVVSVPTEEDNPTTGVRLVIPEGVQSVRPNTKQGWTIQINKTGEGEDQRVSEIVWSGGRIPADQRDEFIFSAQVPASAGSIVWKAYQTYSNGLVVAWENDPKLVETYGKDDHDAPKPYSVTVVKDDLTSENATAQSETPAKGRNSVLPLVATVLSTIAIALHFIKK